jgi:hypothetical protein
MQTSVIANFSPMIPFFINQTSVLIVGLQFVFFSMQQSVQAEQLGKIQEFESEISSLRREKESWLSQQENSAEKKSKDQVPS